MRIGILTGGGDCPGLNAVIRAVTKHAILDFGWEVYGVEDGFRGLIERRVQPLSLATVRGILARGGTILGTTNRGNPFHYPVKLPGGGEEVRDLSATVLENLRWCGIDVLIAVGGDGTLGLARDFGALGAKVIGIPKTIDNDLAATDTTFGFQTAVDVASDALDRLHTTAESHERVMICEVMGRYAGWIALTAGLAGGADVILVPELPYRVERIAEHVRARHRRQSSFSIVCAAEGARPEGGQLAVARAADATRQEKLGGAGERLAAELAVQLPEHEVRVTVLGHLQRGGTPSAFDRVLATRYGVAAVDLIRDGGFGRMVNLRGTHVGSVPLTEAVSQLNLVDPAGEMCAAARATGVELGA